MIKPENILDKWLLAVNKHDIDTLLALYHKSAILMPTFSNRLLNNPNKIREYFEKLTRQKELSVALHEKTLNIQAIENEIYVLCGIYYWRFSLDGELIRFEARFSYILDLSQISPIIHHHSSQIPRML
jgi:hypothetical protein